MNESWGLGARMACLYEFSAAVTVLSPSQASETGYLGLEVAWLLLLPRATQLLRGLSVLEGSFEDIGWTMELLFIACC